MAVLLVHNIVLKILIFGVLLCNFLVFTLEKKFYGHTRDYHVIDEDKPSEDQWEQVFRRWSTEAQYGELSIAQ